jgi:hypothetical protein
MGRTQVTETQIADGVLTGASFDSDLMFYDETQNYTTNDIVVWQGDRYQANTAITGSTEGDLTNAPDQSGDWEKLKSVVYSCYASSQQTFNNVPVTLSLDTERVSNPAITLSSNEITFNSAGIYLVHFEVTLDDTTSTRTVSKGYLEISTDSGANWNAVTNSEAWCYNRTSGAGRGTGSVTLPLEISTGNMIRLQVVCNSSVNIQTITQGCNLTIFTTDGTSGNRGVMGPAGPSGDINWLGAYSSSVTYNINDAVESNGSSYVCVTNGTLNDQPPSSNWNLIAQKGNNGSGSNINIYDEGTSVPNTPHSSLNFKGTNVTVTDAGSGTADVTFQETKHKYQVAIWAEENAGLANNTYEWAFGNGANTGSNGGVSIFVPTGYSCSVVGLSACLGGGSATIELEVNGSLTGETVYVDTSSSRSAATTITSQTITNGSRINFMTQSQSSTAGPCTVTAWLEFTEN